MDTGTGAITTIHLTIIVILAVLAIVAIAWGMKLKRARVAAAKEYAENEQDTRAATERHQAELGTDPLQDTAPEEAAQTQSQSQRRSSTGAVPPHPAPVAAPVTPAPPPIADEPAPGTPPESGAPASADRPVTVLKGLGPKVATALAERGITTVGDLAALDASDADALDAGLGAFRGRMARDRWIEQARFLAAGDVKGFEAVFGRL